MSYSTHRSTRWGWRLAIGFRDVEVAGDMDKSSFAGVGAESLVSMGTTENCGRSIGDHDSSIPSGPLPWEHRRKQCYSPLILMKSPFKHSRGPPLLSVWNWKWLLIFLWQMDYQQKWPVSIPGRSMKIHSVIVHLFLLLPAASNVQ